MENKKSYKSWTISDEFWEKVKDFIPKHERDPNKKYKHAAEGGRKPLEQKKVLEGILQEQAANGKQFLKNTELQVVYIDIFKNGPKLDFLNKFGN